MITTKPIDDSSHPCPSAMVACQYTLGLEKHRFHKKLTSTVESIPAVNHVATVG